MDIEQLKQLQTVDMQIADILQERSELEEALKRDNDAYQNAQEAIEEFNKTYEQLEAERKAKESEVQQTNEMIRRWDIRLKEAKSGREYQAFMREINGAKKDIGEIENAVLKIMEEQESINKSKEEKEKKLDEINKRQEKISKQSEKRISSLSGQMHKFELQRNDIAAKVTPSLLSLYEQIKKQRKIAIVSVKKSICQGCHVNVPPQLYNEVMMNNKIIHCPHCQRILYYEEEKIVQQKSKGKKKAV